MTDNRLDEIRAREQSMREKHFLPEDNEIRYLLQLLDARPAVTGEARKLARGIIARWTTKLDNLDSRLPQLLIDAIAAAITAHANQRYREGVDSVAGIADQWANSHSCDSHDNNPCCHIRTGAAIRDAISALLERE